jgi:hypothetical protein
MDDWQKLGAGTGFVRVDERGIVVQRHLKIEPSSSRPRTCPKVCQAFEGQRLLP